MKKRNIRSPNAPMTIEQAQAAGTKKHGADTNAPVIADRAQTAPLKKQNAQPKGPTIVSKDQTACARAQTSLAKQQNADARVSATADKEQAICAKMQMVPTKEQNTQTKASTIASAAPIARAKEPMISPEIHMTSRGEQKYPQKQAPRSANLPAAGLVALLLLLWQGIAMRLGAAYILPSPTQILIRLWALREPLLRVHLPATMLVTAVGLLISIALGLLLAVAMDASPLAEKAFYPIIIASQTIPTTAIAPLFVLWFGYGIWSKVLVTVLITFFPITISMFDGFRSVKTEMEELLFTYGADRRAIFVKLKLPAALPFFFSAIKMAVPLSIIGAAIGEWLGAQSGLGYFSRRMMTQLDGAGVFAPIVLLSAVAMLIVGLIGLIERAVIRWRKEL